MSPWRSSACLFPGLFRTFGELVRWCSPPRPTKLRSQRDINLWRIPLQLSLAAVALFGITLIPDILDKYHVIYIPSWLSMGSTDDARAILSAIQKLRSRRSERAVLRCAAFPPTRLLARNSFRVRCQTLHSERICNFS